MTGSPAPYLIETSEGVLVRLHVQPKASSTGLAGIHDAAIKLKVQAPAADGAANMACQKYLAQILNIPRSMITMKSGARSRKKTFLIRGISLEDAAEHLR
jgi:uncharacterized protein (TIGR00251 family)